VALWSFQDGILVLMLDDEGADGSQVDEERDKGGTSNIEREWKDKTLRFLVDMC